MGTPVSSTNKTDYHEITVILLKVALNTITSNHISKIEVVAPAPKKYYRLYALHFFSQKSPNRIHLKFSP
jgi:hypothetical protein